MLRFSVIIPAYNEESRLPATLSSVLAYFSQRPERVEILVVDDGSTDNTAAIVESFSRDYEEVKLVSYSANKGKGYAVRTGMLAARGELLLINDADGSSPISEIERLEDAIAGGADIAIGSRAKPDPTRTVQALTHRKFIGNSFNLFVRNLLLPGIYDTQCGFKLFKREAAQDVFSAASINGFAFDVEVLHITKLRGYVLSEVPINWCNCEGSKVNVLSDSPQMLVEVVKVWIRSLLGHYKRVSRRPRNSTIGVAHGVSQRDCSRTF